MFILASEWRELNSSVRHLEWQCDRLLEKVRELERDHERLLAQKPETAAPQPPDTLTFDKFRTANVARCVKWHPKGIASWSPSDWLTAVTGELGELASLLKMRNRERDGLPGNKFSPTDKQIADELADVFTYLDLLAAALGIDLGHAAVEKFNEVSERIGFPDRVDLAQPTRAVSDFNLYTSKKSEFPQPPDDELARLEKYFAHYAATWIVENQAEFQDGIIADAKRYLERHPTEPNLVRVKETDARQYAADWVSNGERK